MSARPLLSRRSVLGGAGAVVVGAATAASSEAAAPQDLRPGGHFDRLVEERAADGRFSGIVRLAHRGRAVLTRSYGLANRDPDRPNRPDTRFDLASMTKQFTAVAVAQLVQRGRLRLDDPVGEYVTGLESAVAASVTVHHLLTHTSGFGRPPLQGPGEEPPPAPIGVEQTWEARMELLRSLPAPDFAPGSRHRYSNDGFFLLGAVIAAVSGTTFHEYVADHVFGPAKLRDTGFPTVRQLRADERWARLYEPRDGAFADVTASDRFRYIGGPDEGATSTVADLVRFATALTDDDVLLAPAYAHLVTSPKVVAPPPSPDRPGPPRDHGFYGYGHSSSILRGRRIHGHSGSGPGRSTNLDVFPDLGWVSVVLSNHHDDIDPIVGLARELVTA
ncbi:serine hydrolase [Jiangella sp. DSM 45060]|uniref:serine hydrolase domain-containing protein n=1 Tax=Jiangella sp. DSM 45060 TaxID=1798224 RepID=UPI00087C87A7|nr:serine hydrolase domain-containing protein [Jiangella sp. DSM 45060]SDS58217.1 CubicO group peptidase, beta-lactamase class C family [Jiangella sp. DSM 45060]